MGIKFAAYLYTGSASMLSEAIHSLADAANQVCSGDLFGKNNMQRKNSEEMLVFTYGDKTG